MDIQSVFISLVETPLIPRTPLIKAARKAVFICFWPTFFCFNTAIASKETQTEEKTEPLAHAYLALGNDNERPFYNKKHVFDCDDKIFAVAELSHYETGKHEFSVQWKDPAGDVRELTRYPFPIHNSETRLWSWLSLRRGAGANMFRWIDSSAGLEGLIGPWKVKISINGKKLAELDMEINC